MNGTEVETGILKALHKLELTVLMVTGSEMNTSLEFVHLRAKTEETESVILSSLCCHL